jgi:alpha-ketoglutarate-dependent taurine dioxygenase
MIEMLTLEPLSEAIGSEVSGIDLALLRPDADFDRIREAWLRTSILLFRGQTLTPPQLIALTRRFGEIVTYTRSENAHPDYPEVLVLSNLCRDGKRIGSPASGRYWHSDGHFLKTPPAATFLYGVEVPPTGGDTWFCNMQAAYEALPSELKRRLDGLKVIISRVQSRPYNYPEKPPVTPEERAAWPDMPHPLVRTHPVTGRKALYIGGNVPWRVEGMPPEESEPLITGLQAFAIRPEFLYVHRWRAGDVILWDNRSSMHKATAYDEVNHRRLMYRTTIEGDEPY